MIGAIVEIGLTILHAKMADTQLHQREMFTIGRQGIVRVHLIISKSVKVCSVKTVNRIVLEVQLRFEDMEWLCVQGGSEKNRFGHP